MARAALFAALLLVGLAACSAFDLSEFPSEVLDFVKDKVGSFSCRCAVDEAVHCTPAGHVSAFSDSTSAGSNPAARKTASTGLECNIRC